MSSAAETSFAAEPYSEAASSAAARAPNHASWKVRITLVVALFLLLADSVWLIVSTGTAIRAAREYSNSHAARAALINLQTALSTAEASHRGYLLTRDGSYASALQQARALWSSELQRLRGLDERTDDQDLARLQQLATAFDALEDSLDQDGLHALAQARPAVEQLKNHTAQLVVSQARRVDDLRADVERTLWWAVAGAVLTAIVAAAVLIKLYKLLNRYVAARERAEAALRNTNEALNRLVEQRTQELSELSHHLIRISEEEKANLARELHDLLGSNLTAIYIDLNRVLKRLPENSPELKERLQRALQVLTDTVELKRGVIEGLRPSHLDNLGLGFAVRTYCEDFSQRTGLSCSSDVDEDFEIDPVWSIALYRIAQEALTNVAKHARAETAHVSLRYEADGIRLTIEDDGVGIPEAAMSKPKSHGLIGMRERMRQVGGQVVVRRGANGGTVVEAFVPFPALMSDAADNAPEGTHTH